MKKYWIGDLSEGCQVCGSPFGKVMYDCAIPTHGMMWGNICRLCFSVSGAKLGLGKGQKYELEKSGKNEGRYFKTEG